MFDSLASRGEPPQFGADGKPIPARSNPSPIRLVAPPRRRRRRAATRPIAAAPAPAQQNTHAPAPAQPAPLPGQQDPEAIRTTTLAFLQQQSAGLPGKSTSPSHPPFHAVSTACMVLEPFMPTGARLWGRKPSAYVARASGRGPSICRRASRCMPPTTSPARDVAGRSADGRRPRRARGRPDRLASSDRDGPVASRRLRHVTRVSRAGMPLRRECSRARRLCRSDKQCAWSQPVKDSRFRRKAAR